VSRRAWSPAVVAAALLALATPTAAPAAITSQTVTGSGSPATQSQTALGPASLRIDLDFAYDATKAPRLTEAVIHTDNDFSFDTTGLTECDPATLAGTTTAQAIAACPGAKVGSGTADFQDGAGTNYHAIVTAFNAVRDNPALPKLALHIRNDAAGTTGVHTGVGSPSSLGGDYGSQVRITFNFNPAVVPTNLDVTLGNEPEAVDDGYIRARCNDNDPGHSWNFAADFTYSDSSMASDTHVQHCQLPVSLPAFGPTRTVFTASGFNGGLAELETGDLNDDGITDVVVTRIEYNLGGALQPLGILLGNGQGGFTDGSVLFEGAIPRTHTAGEIEIADFNGDGRDDIFYADFGYDGPPFPGRQNTLVLSTPQGKLVDATGNLPQVSDATHSSTIADIDDDNDLDIYVGNYCCGGASPEILVNDGTGHFGTGAGLLPAGIQNLNQQLYSRALFLDANGDEAPDLVLGADAAFGAGPGQSEVLLNDGTGHFSAVPNAMPPKEFGATGITISLATLDANDDGDPDLIAGFTRSNPFYADRRLQVLISNGDGTFADQTASRLPVQDEATGPNIWPKRIRVSDLNGDGQLDFSIMSSFANVFGDAPAPAHYLDDGTGVFRLHFAGGALRFFAPIDANSDGRLDLVGVSNPFSPTTPANPERHLLQLQTSPNDRDGDGIVNGADNCPDVANFDQANADGDAQGNACDATPNGPPATPSTPSTPSSSGSGASKPKCKKAKKSAAAAKKCKKAKK
jgi:hypothetical protein